MMLKLTLALGLALGTRRIVSAFGPQADRPTTAVHGRADAGLTLFEFTNASQPWVVTNDPVMGGVSNSTFSVVGGVGTFSTTLLPFL